MNIRKRSGPKYNYKSNTNLSSVSSNRNNF